MREMCQPKENPLAGQPSELSWIQEYLFILSNRSKALEFDKTRAGFRIREKVEGDH